MGPGTLCSPGLGDRGHLGVPYDRFGTYGRDTHQSGRNPSFDSVKTSIRTILGSLVVMGFEPVFGLGTIRSTYTGRSYSSRFGSGERGGDCSGGRLAGRLDRRGRLVAELRFGGRRDFLFAGGCGVPDGSLDLGGHRDLSGLGDGLGRRSGRLDGILQVGRRGRLGDLGIGGLPSRGARARYRTPRPAGLAVTSRWFRFSATGRRGKVRRDGHHHASLLITRVHDPAVEMLSLRDQTGQPKPLR